MLQVIGCFECLDARNFDPITGIQNKNIADRDVAIPAAAANLKPLCAG